MSTYFWKHRGLQSGWLGAPIFLPPISGLGHRPQSSQTPGASWCSRALAHTRTDLQHALSLSGHLSWPRTCVLVSSTFSAQIFRRMSRSLSSSPAVFPLDWVSAKAGARSQEFIAVPSQPRAKHTKTVCEISCPYVHGL